MVDVVRTLAPANGISFDNIGSFETKGYIGIWNHAESRYILLSRGDCELHITTLPRCESLDELDDAVFEECDEHISGVSESQSYEFKLIDEER